MSNLVLIKRQDNQEIPVTTSKIMAEGSSNQHHTVTKLIQTYENDFAEFGRVRFEIDALRTKGGMQQSKVYLLNEDQALLLITYMRNNDIVRKLKIALIKEFRAMKNLLSQKQTPQWQQARQGGKLHDAVLKQTIKLFVDYAFRQGSLHANKYFQHFETLANKALGIEVGQRDYTDADTLAAQIFLFNVINKTILEEMAKETHYKKVYPAVKEKVEQFSYYIQPQQLRIGG